MNIDGCVKGSLGRVGVVGIFCDKEVKWVGGFVVNMGVVSVFMAELRVFWIGLIEVRR